MDVFDCRSPHEVVGGIVYFGRMLDKIRLHHEGRLPAEYHQNLGSGFDERCVNFLGVTYPALVQRVKEGGTDAEILEWCRRGGRHPSTEEIEVWNGFMRKRGWNDEASALLQRRLQEAGFSDRNDVQTFFDFIDRDEGRDRHPASR